MKKREQLRKIRYGYDTDTDRLDTEIRYVTGGLLKTPVPYPSLVPLSVSRIQKSRRGSRGPNAPSKNANGIEPFGCGRRLAHRFTANLFARLIGSMSTTTMLCVRQPLLP